MRVEPFGIDSYIHTIKRGARGLDIVRDESDKWRFPRLLYFMNDTYINWEWAKVSRGSNLFERPSSWPEREQLVYVLAYTLMPNHIHLLLKEIRDGGVSSFMKKLGQSMTMHSNGKYGEIGSMFQGSYRSKTIDSDEYLQHVAVYIMVKNTLELYPQGGIAGAQKNFEDAWKWACEYPFSSIGDYAGVRRGSPLLTKEILGEIFKTPREFKTFSKDVIASGSWESSQFE